MLFLGVFLLGVLMKPNGGNDDAAFIRRAKEGSMEAFEALIKRYQQPIYALCRRMTGRAVGGNAVRPGSTASALDASKIVSLDC
jgi:hypothetical protein